MLRLYVTIIIVISSLNSAAHGQGNTIYVKASEDSSCPNGIPESKCRTLDWYSHNVDTSFTSDTQMVFLTGGHSLKTFVQVLNCHNFIMTGNQSRMLHTSNGPSQPASRILCNEQSNGGLLFVNSSEISIQNLVFLNCSGQAKFTNFSPRVALSFDRVMDIMLYQVVINNTKGFGLYLTNVFGNISVKESAFMNAHGDNETHGGNARFWFDHNLETDFEIYNCLFLYGRDPHDYRNATGLQFFIYSRGVHVTMLNIVARGNRGYQGGNIALTLVDFGSNVSTVTINNSKIVEGQAQRGGSALRLWSLIKTGSEFSQNVKFLQIFNCTFSSNYAKDAGGAIYIEHYVARDYFALHRQREITIANCHFEQNTGKAAAMEVVQQTFPNYISHLTPQFNISIDSCVFDNNMYSGDSEAEDEQNSIMEIVDIKGIHLSKCTFKNNRGSAVSLRSSILNFHDDISFINNSASYGAALKVCDSSLVFLHNRTKVLFQNNSAQKGGAIYAHQSCLDIPPACLFQPAIERIVTIEELSDYIRVKFANNTALLVGDAIYGGSFDFCYIIQSHELSDGTYHHHFNDNRKLFQLIFDTEEQNGPSNISSNPHGVCFCRGEIEMCNTSSSSYSVYPGEIFNVSLTTIGQYNRVSFGLIDANLINAHPEDKLLSLNNSLTPHKGCTNLTYKLMSGYSNVSINFTTITYDGNVYYNQINATLSVSLLPCPLGFKLTSKRCDCHPLVYDMTKQARCDIDTKIIHIPAKVHRWFGCQAATNENGDTNNSSTHCRLIMSRFCTNYCTSNAFRVNVSNLSSFDDQCLSGRTGVMCGGCKPGLSQTFGSSKICKPCSNRNLLFLIPTFLLSGIAILFLLSFLNLTVAEGTINGFIVYVNIMETHSYLFHDHGLMGQICRAFVGALNLGFGFNICFYNGMDGYQHVWLTYVYIFHLLAIQGVIIYLCRRFVFFTRLFGRNIVQVLATVVFLMYSPLLFTIVQTFQCTHLKMWTPNGTIYKLVWYRDGRIPYLGSKHIPLFIVGLLSGIVLLWFTFSLLLVQCLQRKTHMICFKWVERVRPFFDAFTGPCQDNYRFWPGFLTFMRLGLYILNTVTLTFSGSHLQTKLTSLGTAIVCVTILSFSCIFPHGVYKKWPLNMLEFSFFLNLCITSSMWTISSKNSSAVVYTSIFIAMAEFLGIIAYHICVKLSSNNNRCKNIKMWCSVRKNLFKKHVKRLCCPKCDPSDTSESSLLLPQPLPPVVHCGEYREPLIDCNGTTED